MERIKVQNLHETLPYNEIGDYESERKIAKVVEGELVLVEERE